MTPQPSHTIHPMRWETKARGRRRNNRPAVEIRFTQGLFDQIKAEAIAREWSFNRMVNHLCEASIEGIE